jgi:hypothetical protein
MGLPPTTPVPARDLSASSVPARTVLAGEVSNFLIQFSIFLHQQAAYPAGHPILMSSASAATIRLSSLMLERESFAIGVAGDRLVIDGASTDPNHAVLRELAEQLHRQQLGVVRFWRGVGPQELEDLVSAMAAARVADRPLGLTLGGRSQTRWAHIQLERHAYDQLALAGDDEKSAGGTVGTTSALAGTANPLWMALAARALATDVGDGSSIGVQQVAQAIEERKDDAEYDRVIVEYLLQLGRETRRAESPDGGVVSGQLQELLRTVPADTLRQLLHLGASLEQRRELLELVANDLPVSTVLLILNAAAADSGQSISHNLLRILGKLALQAESGAIPVRPAADAAVRGSVRRLLDQWSLKDPNPSSHTRILDRLSRAATPEAGSAEPSGSAALRIIHMSLEVGVGGPMVGRAINDLIAQGQVTLLIDLLRQAQDSPASTAAWEHLATPATLEQLLLLDEIDSETVEALITRLGPGAAGPMLDALTQSNSRTARRRLLTWLRHLGHQIGPLVVERLPNSPWYVQRNLLGLLGSLPERPPGFSALPYAAHNDARVRREALKILFRTPEQYEEAVLRAIKDEDVQIVALGLTMAQEQFPPTAGPGIVAAIHLREWPAEVRVHAIRVLALSTSQQVGRWLVEQAVTRERWYRRKKLAARSPEMLAALSVLAIRWSREASAMEALDLARKSRDPAIRAAAEQPEKR